VKKIREIIKYKSIYPNSTMESDWDILAEIRSSMLELSAKQYPTIRHIKGHQDAHRPFKDLSLPAQLNCKADALAEEYLHENPDIDHSRAPLMPSTGCQLVLSKGTTTRKIKQELKHARAAPRLKAYMCEKHAWSDEEFYDIDWQMHGRGIKKLEKHRKTLVQYLHDWTPTGKQAHRYDPKYPASCPSCTAPVETREHLWQCPAQSREKWRQEFYSTMVKTLTELDTAPPIQELMLEAFKALLEQRDTATIPVDPSVADIAAAQTEIGWHQIRKGRFSKSWREAQTRYLGSRATKHNNGETWMTKIIAAILREWLRMWALRNEDRHGRDYNTRRQAEERQAIRELQQFYETNDGRVVPRLQWLFDIPLEERSEWTVGNIRIWLNAWKPVIDKSYTTDLETG